MLFLDVLAAMLQLRRGLRIEVEDASALAASTANGKGRRPQDVVVIDAASLSNGDLQDAATAFPPAAGMRFLLISPVGDGFVAPAWIRERPHAVVSRGDSFQILLERLESLFPNAAPPAASGDESFRHKPLTDREAEIVALMGDGLTTREIADVLGRSIFTIQTHRKRIAEKLGRLGCSLTQRSMEHRTKHFKGRGRNC